MADFTPIAMSTLQFGARIADLTSISSPSATRIRPSSCGFYSRPEATPLRPTPAAKSLLDNDNTPTVNGNGRRVGFRKTLYLRIVIDVASNLICFRTKMLPEKKNRNNQLGFAWKKSACCEAFAA